MGKKSNKFPKFAGGSHQDKGPSWADTERPRPACEGLLPSELLPSELTGTGRCGAELSSALQSAERRALRRSGGTQPHAGRSLPPLPGTTTGKKGRGKKGRRGSTARPPGGRGEGANSALCPPTAAAAAGSMGKAEAAEPARQAGRRGGSAARG